MLTKNAVKTAFFVIADNCRERTILMKNRTVKIMALIMATVIALTGCGSSKGAATTADSKSVVTLARDLDSNNLDPIMTADNCKTASFAVR